MAASYSIMAKNGSIRLDLLPQKKMNHLQLRVVVRDKKCYRIFFLSMYCVYWSSSSSQTVKYCNIINMKGQFENVKRALIMPDGQT